MRVRIRVGVGVVVVVDPGSDIRLRAGDNSNFDKHTRHSVP